MAESVQEMLRRLVNPGSRAYPERPPRAMTRGYSGQNERGYPSSMSGESVDDPRLRAMQEMQDAQPRRGGVSGSDAGGMRSNPEMASARDRRQVQDMPTDGNLESFVDQFGHQALPPMSPDQMDSRAPGYVPTPRPRDPEQPQSDDELLQMVHDMMGQGAQPKKNKKHPDDLGNQSNDEESDDRDDGR